MRKIGLLVCCLFGLGIGLWASAQDVVSPASCTFTNNRTEGVTYVADTEYYKGASLLFTNCVIQTTGTNIQGLSAVIVEVKWGSATASNTYTGTVQTAAAGTWGLNLNISTNYDAPNIQIKVTDTNGNSFIYPWKLIHLKTAM